MKPKFNISLTIILLILILIFSGNIILLLNYLAALMLHEIGHIIAIKAKHYNIGSIFYSFGGMRISVVETINSDDEFVISFAGPCVNILIALFCVAFWWILPESYFFTHIFCQCNIFLAAFNLLPVEPLDGSRILNSMLNKYSCKKIRLIKIILNTVLTLFCLTFFIISCFRNLSLIWAMLTLFFLFNSTQKQPKAIHQRILFFKKNKPLKPKTIKFIYLPSDATLLTAFGLISNRHYTVFLYMSKLFSQDWVLNKLKLLPSTTKIIDC